MRFISLIILSLFLSSCEPYCSRTQDFLFRPDCPRGNVYEDPLAKLHCEDGAFIGYTSSYLGHKKWMKLVDSYNKAKERSPYNNGCKEWNPHYCGHRIFIEGNK